VFLENIILFLHLKFRNIFLMRRLDSSTKLSEAIGNNLQAALVEESNRSIS